MSIARNLMGRIPSAALGVAVAWFVVGGTLAQAGASGGLGGEHEWPMFHGGYTHTGASKADGPTSATVSWTFTSCGSCQGKDSSPVVGSDGTVYLLQTRTHPLQLIVKAISATTHLALWSWRGPNGSKNLFNTPAVAPDGDVYVAEDHSEADQPDDDLFAIRNGGTTLWTLSGLNLAFSPTIGPDGTIYVVSDSSVLYAVNPENGHIYWKFAGSTSYSAENPETPAISRDGKTVYLSNSAGLLYALSAGPTGGKLAWTYQIQRPTGGWANIPAVGPDGTIYVSTGGDGLPPGDIDAVNPDGSLKWVYQSPNGSFLDTPTVTAAGQVVAVSDTGGTGTVVAVEQTDGALAWSYALPNSTDSSAASDAAGNIYIADDGPLFALRPTGSVLWNTGEGGEASPGMDDSGTLYVAPGGNTLIAYG
jgi:outer membrane protein assembly factor BamB